MTAHSTRLGHSIEAINLEIPFSELDCEESRLKTYPKVCTDPKTNKESLQVRSLAAWRVHLKDSEDGEVRVVDDLKEVRAFTDRISRLLSPTISTLMHTRKGSNSMVQTRTVAFFCESLPPTGFKGRGDLFGLI